MNERACSLAVKNVVQMATQRSNCASASLTVCVEVLKTRERSCARYRTDETLPWRQNQTWQSCSVSLFVWSCRGSGV